MEIREYSVEELTECYNQLQTLDANSKEYSIISQQFLFMVHCNTLMNCRELNKERKGPVVYVRKKLDI